MTPAPSEDELFDNRQPLNDMEHVMDAKERTLSRGDLVALAMFVIAGIAITAWTIWQTAVRIAQLAVGRDVPVAVEFLGSLAETQLGDGRIAVRLDRATVMVDSLGTMGTVTGIIGQAIFALTITGVVVCLILLSRNLMRGRVFSKGNTAIVMTGGMIGLLGAAGSRFFDNMLANATVAQLTDGPTETAVITVEPFGFILAAFALSVIGTVFVVGARLQRETEGLV